MASDNKIPGCNKSCACRICKLLRRIEPLLAKASKDERAAMDELMLDWEHCSTSAAYWEMKFRGTWPGDGGQMADPGDLSLSKLEYADAEVDALRDGGFVE